MKVVIVSPKHWLEDDLYGSGAKVREDYKGLLITDVISVRTFDEIIDDTYFDLIITYIDDYGKFNSIGVFKSEFVELRVYVD